MTDVFIDIHEPNLLLSRIVYLFLVLTAYRCDPDISEVMSCT